MLTRNSRFSIGLTIVLIVLCWPQMASAQFQAGAAKRSIQPKLPTGVSGGLGAPKMAKVARGELTARAVVVASGDNRLAICSVDLIGFPAVLIDRVRAKVKGVAPDHILIGSTHTHSAPDPYGFPSFIGGQSSGLEYLDLVVERAAEAIQAAVDSLEPAVLRTATDEAEGKIAYNYYAPDLYDRRMSVLQARKPSGEAIFTMVNYATHPEVLGNEVGFVSPDLVGPLCDKVESDVGGMAIFMNGAQGGMITADNRLLDQNRDPLRAYWNDARTWEECIRIGQLMASEAQRIISDAPVQQNPALFIKAQPTRFPIESDVIWQVLQLSPLKYPVDRETRSITTLIHLINLGDTQIATIPGEAMPNIGFYLKRKMKGKHQMLFGLTNDAFGYILTKVDFNSFPRYKYISETGLGEMTGEIVIENILKLVEQSPQPE